MIRLRHQSVAPKDRPKHRNWCGAIAFMSLALTGCFNYSPTKMEMATEVVERRLPAMHDGQTKRAGIVGTLGPPTMTLSHGRIIAYDLLLQQDHKAIEKAYHESKAKHHKWEEIQKQWIFEHAPMIVLSRTLPDPVTREMQYDLDWSPEYMLVLVFDARDVLQRHRIWSITP